MIVHPKRAKKHVQLLSEQEQVQPAGLDLTVKQIFKFIGYGCIDFDNKKRSIAGVEEIHLSDEPRLIDKGAYKIIFNEIVSIPLNMVAIARPRSSLLRNGASIFTALWDPGYEGRSEALLVVFNEHGIKITKNAKIAQLVFLKMESEASSPYKGIYKKENM